MRQYWSGRQPIDERHPRQVLSRRLCQNPAPPSRRSMPVLPFSTPPLTLTNCVAPVQGRAHGHPGDTACWRRRDHSLPGHGKYEPGTYVLPKVRKRPALGHPDWKDSLLKDGLIDAFNDYHMGITAENGKPVYTGQPRRSGMPMPAFPAARPMRRSCRTLSE